MEERAAPPRPRSRRLDIASCGAIQATSYDAPHRPSAGPVQYAWRVQTTDVVSTVLGGSHVWALGCRRPPSRPDTAGAPSERRTSIWLISASRTRDILVTGYCCEPATATVRRRDRNRLRRHCGSGESRRPSDARPDVAARIYCGPPSGGILSTPQLILPIPIAIPRELPAPQTQPPAPRRSVIDRVTRVVKLLPSPWLI